MPAVSRTRYCREAGRASSWAAKKLSTRSNSIRPTPCARSRSATRWPSNELFAAPRNSISGCTAAGRARPARKGDTAARRREGWSSGFGEVSDSNTRHFGRYGVNLDSLQYRLPVVLARFGCRVTEVAHDPVNDPSQGFALHPLGTIPPDRGNRGL